MTSGNDNQSPHDCVKSFCALSEDFDSFSNGHQLTNNRGFAALLFFYLNHTMARTDNTPIPQFLKSNNEQKIVSKSHTYFIR